MMTEKIRLVLAKRDMTKADLARKMGCSYTNVHNKLKRDNLSEKEMLQIAEALNCTLEINFVLNDTGDKF